MKGEWHKQCALLLMPIFNALSIVMIEKVSREKVPLSSEATISFAKARTSLNGAHLLGDLETWGDTGTYTSKGIRMPKVR